MPASRPSEPTSPRRLRLSEICLHHRDGDGRPFRVLDIPHLAVEPGEHVGVRGASGSGKTSLLHLIGGLVSAEAGSVGWGEETVSALPIAARDRWRLATLGFVFQDFHLVPELDVLANILLPARFAHWRLPAALEERARGLAQRMGLSDPRRPAAVLSRGEQQRVAIARALLCRPALILADEPTASLDASQAAAIGALLCEAAHDSGATLICASHDENLLGRMQRIVKVDP